MAHDVFISYSNKNKNIADAVCSKLEQDNIRCWMAPRDITPGEKWAKAICDAIESSAVMVLIFSIYANSSEQVIREVELAIDNKVVVIPFRIEDSKPTGGMGYYLATTHWIDALTPPLEKQIDFLTDIVKPLLEKTNTYQSSLGNESESSDESIQPVVKISSIDNHSYYEKPVKPWYTKLSAKLTAGLLVLILAIWGITTAIKDLASNESFKPTSDTTANSNQKEAIVFEDNRLEIAVRKTINKPQGALLPSDVEVITELQAENMDISNLKGIKYLKNLKSLKLDRNRIEDITEISELSKLEKLWLSSNNVQDIGPLAKLQHLNTLWMGGSTFADITPLTNLPALETLGLSHRAVATDFSILAKMKFLSLHLDNCQIIDVSFLKDLTTLQTLSLKDNKIADISPLKNLIALKELNLQGNPVKDYSPVAGNKDLNLKK